MQTERPSPADPSAVPHVPVRALLISLFALAAPVLAFLTVPRVTEQDLGMLVWLSALIPPFLLTYYRSWRGASVALAAGMAALSLTHVALTLREARPPSLTLLFIATSVLIVVSLGAGWLSDRLHGARAAAESAARTDPLTGLANRRHLSGFLDAAVAAAERGMAVSVVLFDLDGFKHVNDEHGHAEGDRVLRDFGALLASRTRDTNLAGRWGGEEFLTVLVGTDGAGAVIFADRIRAELAAQDFGWGRVTVSGGVAAWDRRSAATPEALVATADRLLYRAKERGRDRVEFEAPAAGTEEAVPVGTGASASARAGRSGPAGTPPPLHGAEPGEGELPRAAPDVADARLLVFHPQIDALRDLTLLLGRCGFRTVRGTADPEAVAVHQARYQPDLLLVDMSQDAPDDHLAGGPDGAAGHAPPVVAVLAPGGGTSPRTVLEAGATEVIHAPLDPWELEARLRTLLRLRRGDAGGAGLPPPLPG